MVGLTVITRVYKIKVWLVDYMFYHYHYRYYFKYIQHNFTHIFTCTMITI